MTEKTEERENVANEVIKKVANAIAMTLKLSDEDISIEKGKEKENFYTIFRNKIEIGNLVVAKDGGVVVVLNREVIPAYGSDLVLMQGDFGNALRRDIGKTQEEKLEAIARAVAIEINELGLGKTVLISYSLTEPHMFDSIIDSLAKIAKISNLEILEKAVNLFKKYKNDDTIWEVAELLGEVAEITKQSVIVEITIDFYLNYKGTTYLDIYETASGIRELLFKMAYLNFKHEQKKQGKSSFGPF